MNKEIFDIDKFNIIQDEENYYFFRALNNGDHNDIKSNITSSEDGIKRIRTDSERFEEEKGQQAKYNSKSEISLEEVWDHIKMRYSKETNCISLSSNSNVSVDYGQSYNNEYVMIKVSKQKESNVYNAGQYMLEEINKRIEKVLKSIQQDSEVFKIIKEIDGENSYKNIKSIVADSYDGIKKVTGKFSATDNQTKGKISITSRLDKKQYFSEEQQLEYNKIIGKLTVLETYGYLRSIIPTRLDNTSLIATVGNAFSSGELIHYKDIKAKDIVQVPKEMMNILSIIQQLKDENERSTELNTLENKVIELINGGYDIIRDNGKITITNGTSTILEKDEENENSDIQQNESVLSIEEIYKLTGGRIAFEKAKNAVQFVNSLSKSRIEARGYAEIIRTLGADYDNIAERIENECYVIDKEIVTRQNNRGVKIASSVNIGIGKEQQTGITNSEQIKLINAIQKLDIERLRKIVATNGLELENEILEEILDKEDAITENQYFAEAIVDSIDFPSIYKNTISEDRKIIKETEKKILLDKLGKADCKKLYNAFKNAGVKHNEISGYIINLLIDKGYKGFSFEELSRAENLDEIISVNVKNSMIKNRISSFRLDELLNIRDDLNEVAGSTIKLRDYQQETIDNIEEIYKEKRFAGVVLPTGAGKSFVAITEMLKNKDKNILYFAPQIEILNQVERHILKNVVGVQVLTESEIKELDGKKAPQGKIYPTEAKAYIAKAFPHLKMYCYQSLNERDEETNEKGLRKILENSDADLIVFDELHRAGAETWEPLIKELIDNNPESKILGITATPIRDVDKRDMMNTLAQITGDCSQEELARGEYLAKEMYLVDAIQDHLVVEPKIVSFNYSLAESEEYKEVQRLYKAEKNESKKAELKSILEQMEGIINNTSDIQEMILNETDPEKKKELEERFSEIRKELKKDNTQGIGKIIKENIVKKDGRYIVLLPQNSTGLPTKEYIEKEIEKVKEYLKDIDDNPEVQYLVTGQKKSESISAINNFENSDSEHLKLLFAIDKLNEGVHLDGINGEIMLRKIGEGSRILYLQQLGRVIFSLDPENPIPEEDLPIVFDVYNNYIAQNMYREVNKTTPTSDLQRLQSIVNWINKHGYFPDSNSELISEARKAINLKKIQIKYSKYLEGINNSRLSQKEIAEIEKIMELANSIELFEREIPERIILPNEKDLSESQLFKVSGEQKRFLELFKIATKTATQSKRVSPTTNIRTILDVLQVLNDYGIDINNKTIPINSSFEDIIKDLPEHLKSRVKDEVDIDLDYKIGLEYNNVKSAFTNKEINKIFLDYDIRDLRRYGIFEPYFTYDMSNKNITQEDIDKGLSKEKLHRNYVVDQRGFVKEGVSEFLKINIKTGTYFDEQGYNSYGENPLGFKRNQKLNEYGFDRDGYYYIKKNGEYINTGKKEDQNGFIMDGTWKDTGEKLNPYGFDIKSYYWAKQKDGSFKNTYKFLDPDLFSINGINYNWFNREGFYCEKQEDGTWISTGSKLDKRGFDINGDYWEKQENGEYVNTKRKTDNDGFDILGLDKYGFGRVSKEFYERFPDGTCRRTHAKRDKNGFDVNGINEYGFGRDGFYYIQQEDGTWINTGSTENSRGFHIDGTWKDTGEKIDENGFDLKGDFYRFINGKYEYNGTRDNEGFDVNGINGDGFGRDGYYYIKQEYGTWISSGNKFNERFFDKDGYFWAKDERGEFVNAQTKRDRLGLDKNGKGLDEFGFDEDGNFYQTVNGIYRIKGTRDDKGFDKNGLTEYNFNREGYYCELVRRTDNSSWFKKEVLEWVSTGEKRNPYGFDINGDFWILENGEYVNTGKKEDQYGFNISRKWKDTEDFINPDGFDIDGNYWTKDEDGNLYNTNRKKDPNGNTLKRKKKEKEEIEQAEQTGKSYFDTQGYYHKVQDNGTVINTGLKYNENGFRADGKHVITGTIDDLRGFNIDGKCYLNNRRQWDKGGFKQDGTHRKTGELYYEGYNAFGLDKNGKDRFGKTPPEIIFIREYITEGVTKGKGKKILAKYGIKTRSELNLKLYKATEMCPQVKKILYDQMSKYQLMIKQREEKIKQLESQKTEDKELIEKLKKENAVLRNRISLMNPMHDLDK